MFKKKTSGLAGQTTNIRHVTLGLEGNQTAGHGALQGRAITQLQLDVLKRYQHGEIQQGLKEGLAQFKHFLSGQPVSAALNSFFVNYLAHLDNMLKLTLAEVSDQFADSQIQLYEVIYQQDNELTGQQKFFLEFMIGLSRFILAQQVCAEILKSFNVSDVLPPVRQPFPPENLTDFWSQFSEICDAGLQINLAILAQHEKGHDQFWAHIQSLYQNTAWLEKLSTALVSFQYVPPEADMEVVALAQVAHWQGSGGAGEIFQPHTELHPLIPHTEGYHAATNEDIANKRVNTFKPFLLPLFEHHERLLKYAINENFTTLDEIRVIDFCSGPKAAAVMPLRESTNHVSIVASDVDGNSLQSLLTLKKEGKVHEVLFVDLNIGNYPQFEKPFHLISVRLGLHQLAIKKIWDVVAYFNSIAADGALICISEPGEQVNWLLPVIPINITDREGLMPHTQQMQFQNFAKEIDDDTSQVPYPARQARKIVPAPSGGELLHVTAFQIVQLPNTLLPQLQSFWDQADYESADALVARNADHFYQFLDGWDNDLMEEESPRLKFS